MAENKNITQHDNEDGYHLNCMCDYCRPTTLSNKVEVSEMSKIQEVIVDALHKLAAEVEEGKFGTDAEHFRNFDFEAAIADEVVMCAYVYKPE